MQKKYKASIIFGLLPGLFIMIWLKISIGIQVVNKPGAYFDCRTEFSEAEFAVIFSLFVLIIAFGSIYAVLIGILRKYKKFEIDFITFLIVLIVSPFLWGFISFIIPDMWDTLDKVCKGG